jgi:hypothetical protein
MPVTKSMLIDIDGAKKICKIKGLKPAKLKGSKNLVYFAKGNKINLEMISWEEFERALREKNLGIYHYNGWLKIANK